MFHFFSIVSRVSVVQLSFVQSLGQLMATAATAAVNWRFVCLFVFSIPDSLEEAWILSG